MEIWHWPNFRVLLGFLAFAVLVFLSPFFKSYLLISTLQNSSTAKITLFFFNRSLCPLHSQVLKTVSCLQLLPREGKYRPPPPPRPMRNYYSYPSPLPSAAASARHQPSGRPRCDAERPPLSLQLSCWTSCHATRLNTLRSHSVLSELQAFSRQELCLDLSLFSQTPGFGAVLPVPSRKEGWGPSPGTPSSFQARKCS